MLIFVAACFILLYWPVIDSFFASVKTCISIQLVAIANLNVTPSTLLDPCASAQNESGFPIRILSLSSHERSVQAFIHMML